MSNYTSLFEHWTQGLHTPKDIDDLIATAAQDLGLFGRYSSTVFFIQDYRDLGIRFVTDNLFALTGLYPENFYANGINLGLEIHHPKERSEVLVLQKRAHEFIQSVPPAHRRTIEIRYCAHILHRVHQQHHYVRVTIRPLVLDPQGRVVLDIATWELATPQASDGTFLWELSYYDEAGVRQAVEAPVTQPSRDLLTNAESKVLAQLMLGKTSREIAQALHISKHTVDTHRRRMLKKLSFKSTRALVAWFNSQVAK